MIGLICGGGDYPRLIAETCLSQSIEFCLIFVEGFCDESGWPDVPRLSIEFGEVEKALNFLHTNRVDKIIFAGHVKRPDFHSLSLDKKAALWLLKLGKAVIGGDDQLLRAVSQLLSDEGFEIISGQDILDEAFFNVGVHSQKIPTKQELLDIELGFFSIK